LFLLPVLAAAPRLRAQTGSTVIPSGVARDGVTLDTRAIQEAIDRCGAAGGGQVLLSPGRYLTGTLRLRDRVTLQLEGGAVLLGSPRLEDYLVLHDAIPSYTSVYTERCLIRADGVSDVAIRGAGTIDGNGTAFAGEYKIRPYLMRFIGCRGIQIQGITLQNSAMWVQHYLDCEDVLIDGIRVRSRRQHVNNDGIDIDSCRRLRIANCDIDCGDDAIVLKATTAAPCRDVVVTNCILSTLCSAFKLGTESNGGFDNIVFSDSAIYNTRLAGIALEMVDGGSLHRVSISNIVMRETACPIFLRLGNRARPVTQGDPRPGMGSFSGVMIRGVNAEADSSVVCSITGLPGHPVEDVLLEDIQLSVPGGGAAFAANQLVPELPEAYPEVTMFGKLPAYGLYCRHARGLALNRVAFRAGKSDARPALFAEDVDGLSVSNLSGSDSNRPLIDFRNVRRARIRETQTVDGKQPLVRLEGSETRDVAVTSDQEQEPLVVTGREVSRAAWRTLK
jgi:polygalacturonase